MFACFNAIAVVNPPIPAPMMAISMVDALFCAAKFLWYDGKNVHLS